MMKLVGLPPVGNLSDAGALVALLTGFVTVSVLVADELVEVGLTWADALESIMTLECERSVGLKGLAMDIDAIEFDARLREAAAEDPVEEDRCVTETKGREEDCLVVGKDEAKNAGLLLSFAAVDAAESDTQL